MERTNAVAVRHWIDQLEGLAAQNRCEAPQFLRPHHFVTLAMVLATRGKQGVSLPSTLERYAARMRLWRAVGLSDPVTVVERPANGRFVPLMRLELPADVHDLSVELSAVVERAGCDAQTKDAVLVCMQEILGNCIAHGEVTNVLKAVVCAQTWQQGNLAQIAIADAGVGIRASLAGNPDLHTRLVNGNACDLATELGVTSKPGKGHAGYGLALTRQLLERAGGRLLVLSGNEWVQADANGCTIGAMPTIWQGTVVVLEWKLDAPLCLRDVYESWPLPEGFDDDDFDF